MFPFIRAITFSLTSIKYDNSALDLLQMSGKSKEEQLSHLRTLLPSHEVFEPGSKEYNIQSAPWSTWADQKPTLVLQPTNLDSMSTVVRTLYDSDLDFAIRNTGTGSVSASDVILSTHGFKSFDFSSQDETATIGSGFAWGEVDALMEERAPGWQVVGARCSWVGVTGSSLVGGLSWLSHEFGMISDPQNLLDMQVVLKDGRVVWAAAEGEEDLMWALRGGGGNFGVVTALRLRARRYPTQVFCGLFFYPYSSLSALSKAVNEMHVRKADPKVAMHIVTRGSGMGEPPGGKHPNVAIIMYDANGQEHAHSELAWLWSIPGAQAVQAGMMSVRSVNAVAETFRDWQGQNMFWLCAPMLEHVDEHTLERAWGWWEKAYDTYPGFEEGSTVLLEFMQEVRDSQVPFPSSQNRACKLTIQLNCRPHSPPPPPPQQQHGRTTAAGTSCNSCSAANPTAHPATSAPPS